MRRKALCSSALVLVILACSATRDDQKDPGASAKNPGGVASVTFAQLGNFSGNSVHIVGVRDPAADTKYPCASTLDQCFNFNEDGTLEEGPVDGLCPSVNLPQGDWTFTYEIFTDEDCTGEILNTEGNENNFECFDSTDLASQENPNQSVDEELVIGENVNYILCLSDDAEKEWDFNSCLIVDDGVYNCCGDLTSGEGGAGGGASGGASGLTCNECNVPDDIAIDECTFDPETCVIECPPLGEGGAGGAAPAPAAAKLPD